MSNLSINVQVGTTAPSTTTADGPSLSCDIWPQTAFQRNPQRFSDTPPGSPAASATTDSSGNATFTGLSSQMYWVRVIDARSVNNWFPVAATRIGGADPFICTVPWSTPTTVTSPLDDRGGDTVGGRTNQGLWAPRTHIHEYVEGGGGGGGTPFVGEMIYNWTGGDVGISLPALSQTIAPYVDSDGTSYWRSVITMPPFKFVGGDEIIDTPQTGFLTPSCTALTITGFMGFIIHDLAGTNFMVAEHSFSSGDFSPDTFTRSGFVTTDQIGGAGTDLSITNGNYVGNTAPGVYVTSFWVNLSGTIS